MDGEKISFSPEKIEVMQDPGKKPDMIITEKDTQDADKMVIKPEDIPQEKIKLPQEGDPDFEGFWRKTEEGNL